MAPEPEADKNKALATDKKEVADKSLSSGLNNSMFEVRSDIPPDEYAKLIHRTWPNGLEAREHSLALLAYLGHHFGHPPTRIKGDEVPHNSTVFKYWRNRVSPQIPSTMFVLYYSDQVSLGNFIETYTKIDSSDAKLEPKNNLLSDSISILPELSKNFTELDQLWNNAVESSQSNLIDLQTQFVATHHKDLETDKPIVKILTYTLDDFNNHSEARMALFQSMDMDDIEKYDFKFIATGYIYLKGEKHPDESGTIFEVTFTPPGATNSVQSEFTAQAKVVLDYLRNRPISLDPNAEITIQPYNPRSKTNILKSDLINFDRMLIEQSKV